jgi:D-glycero-D-manno-heptose 1,7-bisphosphate phosphatase
LYHSNLQFPRKIKLHDWINVHGTPIKLALLDRDGVLNRKFPEGDYVRSCDDLELLPGSGEAVRLLNQSGIIAIVLTNQRAIARGLISENDLTVIHDDLRAKLAREDAHLDGIYYCPHDQYECDCRKPKTGMLEQAFRDFPVATRANSILIGDSLSDLVAGRAFGVSTVLLDQTEHESPPASPADFYAPSLLDAVKGILLFNMKKTSDMGKNEA